VLGISHDVVCAAAAGPGVRYDQLSRVLAPEFDGTLAAPEGSTPTETPYASFIYAPRHGGGLDELVSRADDVVVAAPWFAAVPALADSSAAVVVDGYDPALAEAVLTPGVDMQRLSESLTLAYLRGDFFLCASERQRDWWLGLLEAHGRINTRTVAGDPELRLLLDVVPFGLPSEVAEAQPAAIDGVDSGDAVLLWGGGLWEWLDPVTAIRAMPEILAECPGAKLLFPGARHPDAGVPATRSSVEARAAARDLGLDGTAVLFGDWVPREQYPGYLARASVGLSLHQATLEARLAFRTRVLDYIWAGVPMVLTEGDATAEMAASFAIARLVRPGDAHGVAQAILGSLRQPSEEMSQGFAKARSALTWERAAQPLMRFCRQPRRAPDRPERGLARGNAYYEARVAELRGLVAGYERGRFIRFMRWLRTRR